MGQISVPISVKWQIIAYYKLKKYNTTEIAALCSVSRNCVTKTVENWKLTSNAIDKLRRGRPRKSTRRQDRDLIRLAKNNPKWSACRLASHWTDSSNKSIAKKSTVVNRLLEIGLNSYKETEKQMLSEVDKKKRYEWCVERKNWSFAKWSTIIFSDESNFQIVNRKTKAKKDVLLIKNLNLNSNQFEEK
jgi:transposase